MLTPTEDEFRLQLKQSFLFSFYQQETEDKQASGQEITEKRTVIRSVAEGRQNNMLMRYSAANHGQARRQETDKDKPRDKRTERSRVLRDTAKIKKRTQGQEKRNKPRDERQTQEPRPRDKPRDGNRGPVPNCPNQRNRMPPTV